MQTKNRFYRDFRSIQNRNHNTDKALILYISNIFSPNCFRSLISTTKRNITATITLKRMMIAMMTMMMTMKNMVRADDVIIRVDMGWRWSL